MDSQQRLAYLQSMYYPLRWKYDGLDYSFDGALGHLSKYGDIREPGFGNPYIPNDQKLKVLHIIDEWILSDAKSPWIKDLQDFEKKARDKWYGPQGATPTADEVMSVLSSYYDKRIEDMILPSLSDADYQAFSACCKRGSYTFLSPRSLYVRYKGDRKSNSGVIGWCDKREFGIRKRAIMLAIKYPTLIDPMVLGTRDQRQKVPCRDIFMDSFANYYREVQAYNIFECELKDCDAIMWRGERYVEEYIYNFIKRPGELVFFEGDYEMLDSWIQDEHVDWLLSVFDEICIIDPALRQYQKDLTYALFRGPVWTPKGEMTGVHNLFSGIYPTNPFESPWNLLVQIMWINNVVSPHVGRQLIRDVDYIIVVLGDDSLVIFRNIIFSDSELEWLQESFSSYVWTTQHVKANPLKQRVSRSSGFFCKRQYKREGVQYSPFGDSRTFPKALYSLYLACMSIFEPEDGALDTKAQSLIKLFQVMDNAYGHPLWKMLLRKLWEIQPGLHILLTEQDVEEFNTKTNKNWRLIVFGEKFSLEKSRSAQLWVKWSIAK